MRRWAVRGQQWCERVGRRERRADEREIGCQMCRNEDRKRVLLQIEKGQRQEEMVWWEMKGKPRQTK